MAEGFFLFRSSGVESRLLAWFPPAEITGQIEGHSLMGYKQKKWEVLLSLQDFTSARLLAGLRWKKMNIQRRVLPSRMQPLKGSACKGCEKVFSVHPPPTRPASARRDTPALSPAWNASSSKLSMSNYSRVRAAESSDWRQIQSPDFSLRRRKV